MIPVRSRDMNGDEDYVPSDEDVEEDGLEDEDMEEEFDDETAFLTANRGQEHDAGDGMALDWHDMLLVIRKCSPFPGGPSSGRWKCGSTCPAGEEDDAAPEHIFGEGFDPMSLLDQLGRHEQDFDPNKQPYGGLKRARDGVNPPQVKVHLCHALADPSMPHMRALGCGTQWNGIACTAHPTLAFMPMQV